VPVHAYAYTLLNADADTCKLVFPEPTTNAFTLSSKLLLATLYASFVATPSNNVFASSNTVFASEMIEASLLSFAAAIVVSASFTYVCNPSLASFSANTASYAFCNVVTAFVISSCIFLCCNLLCLL